MFYIKQLIKSYRTRVLDGKWWNFVFMLLLIFTAVILVHSYKFLLNSAGETIIVNHKKYIWYVIPVCIAIGFYHARVKKDKEYNILLLRFFSNPLFASSLVCLTYGVVIDSSLALLYIILYDENTIQCYPYLDTTTVTCTLVLALLWGVNGILTMVGNIIWPNKTPVGLSEKKESNT